jgi:hypothetical protein
MDAILECTLQYLIEPPAKNDLVFNFLHIFNLAAPQAK